MKSPIVLLRRLLKDFQRLNPDVKGLERDLKTLESRFEHEGYGFLAVALDALDHAILHGLMSRHFLCPTGFKKTRKGAIPVFLQGMVQEVFDPTTGILKEAPNIGVLKDLHQVLRLFKKTQLLDGEVERLHKKAVDEFFDCEKEVGGASMSNLVNFHRQLCFDLRITDSKFKESVQREVQTRSRCRCGRFLPQSEVVGGGESCKECNFRLGSLRIRVPRSRPDSLVREDSAYGKLQFPGPRTKALWKKGFLR
jgi:hypothetical protein